MKKVYLAFLALLIVLCVFLVYNHIFRPIEVALIGNFVEERYIFVANSTVAERIAKSDINNGSRISGRKVQLLISGSGRDTAFMIIKDEYEDKYEKHLTLKEAINRRNAAEDQDQNVSFDKYGDSNGEEAVFIIRDEEFTKLGGKQHESAKN